MNSLLHRKTFEVLSKFLLSTSVLLVWVERHVGVGILVCLNKRV